MKVVTAKEMSRCEKEAFAEGASEQQFMFAAGKGVADAVRNYVVDNWCDECVTILCGKGNNAGDGYVAASLLHDSGYRIVVFQLFPIESCSELCQYHQRRFLDMGGVVNHLEEGENVSFPSSGVILDGLLGTGFKGETKELLAHVIKQANESSLPIISIDIPSGINGNDGSRGGEAIIAAMTVFLGLPKVGFFLEKGPRHVGELCCVDFGLGQTYIDSAQEQYQYLQLHDVRHFLPAIWRDRHKYEAGYVVGLAGSPGMPGAAILSCLAALRGGAGMVRLLYPQGMEAELSSAPYEIVRQAYDSSDGDMIIRILNGASAVFIGPGIGREDGMRHLLSQILPELSVPCIFDADGLNIIANDDGLSFPKGAIITPHLGEMCRLLGCAKKKRIDAEFLLSCKKYCIERKLIGIVKGVTTVIIQPSEPPIVFQCGDPGMATAGSGDVLTGLIATLLAQGLTPIHAAQLGVAFHGEAGKKAAREKTSYCMIASDIIEAFPEVYTL